MPPKLTKAEQRKLIKQLPAKQQKKIQKAGLKAAKKQVTTGRKARVGGQDGSGLFGSILKAVAPVALDLGHAALKKKIGGAAKPVRKPVRKRRTGGALRLAGR